MNIQELIIATVSSPELFWGAIAAIAQALATIVVLASAIVIVFQLRQMRRESIADRISGLKAALEVLNSDLFNKVSREVMAETKIQGVNWRSLLDQINFVALLISEDYTDDSLLFSLKGHELGSIGEYLQNNRPSSDIQSELNTKYASAYSLLKRAWEWHRKESVA